MVRLATCDDLDFLDLNDPLLKREAIADKIDRGEVYVAQDGDRLVGLARYDHFCDLDPFLTLIMVLEGYRRKGVGTRLMEYWERQMIEKGHRFLLTSTEAAEDAQFFYRKLGYVDTGSIIFPGQDAIELVLIKQLRKPGEGFGPRQKEIL
jgi:GNAT superfamily N-acetyltransferase